MAKEIEKTDRGFSVYGKVTDSKGSEVAVQESSAVGRPCVWIFARHPSPDYENPSPHLTVENAKDLIQILQEFIDDADSPENWRNSDDYRETWG
jgi:hypothetical protein